jgi:hypothetical protein
LREKREMRERGGRIGGKGARGAPGLGRAAGQADNPQVALAYL